MEYITFRNLATGKTTKNQHEVRMGHKQYFQLCRQVTFKVSVCEIFVLSVTADLVSYKLDSSHIGSYSLLYMFQIRVHLLQIEQE
jgi:hypothetical protein